MLLRRRWEMAREGEGQSVLIQGEAGVGKSRLAKALADEAEASGALVLNGYCNLDEQNTALAPFADLLTRWMKIQPSWDTEARRAALSELARAYDLDAAQTTALLAPLLSADVPSDLIEVLGGRPADSVRRMTLEVIVDLLCTAAEERPTLTSFEDLHWADPTTLELLPRGSLAGRPLRRCSPRRARWG